MAVQNKVLTRTLDGSTITKWIDATGTEQTGSKTLQAQVGDLALGKPGDIYSRAYGPVAYTFGDLTNDTEFGTFVADKGILVNGNDVANESAKFEPSTVLRKGQVGAFMVSGAAVVLCKNVEAIKAAMNARVIQTDYLTGNPDYDESGATDYTSEEHKNDVCVIEVNGFLAE